MLQKLKELVAALSKEIAAHDPATLSASEAIEVIDVSSEGERLCQAARTLAMQAAFRDAPWHASGYRTPAQWLAAKTKKTLSSAITTVETAWHLDQFPQTKQQFISGEISEIQAAQITEAAAADPGAEQGLLELASRESVGALKQRCREVVAAASPDQDSAERIRARRYCRHWVEKDGAVRLDARMAPDDAGPLVATLDWAAAALAEQAARSGRREPLQAYAADALVGMATGNHGPATVLHLTADVSAWDRGRTVSGERCVIEGVGPIPVSSAKRLAADGVVKVVLTHGDDVVAVSHLGRTIPARLRTALEARDPTCVVPGCDARLGLEIDHIKPISEGGLTELANLARLCRYHHGQKTHHGARLGGGPGAWTWTPRRLAQARTREHTRGNRSRAP